MGVGLGCGSVGRSGSRSGSGSARCWLESRVGLSGPLVLTSCRLPSLERSDTWQFHPASSPIFSENTCTGNVKSLEKTVMVISTKRTFTFTSIYMTQI